MYKARKYSLWTFKLQEKTKIKKVGRLQSLEVKKSSLQIQTSGTGREYNTY